MDFRGLKTPAPLKPYAASNDNAALRDFRGLKTPAPLKLDAAFDAYKIWADFRGLKTPAPLKPTVYQTALYRAYISGVLRPRPH